jgi:hypothetical protein
MSTNCKARTKHGTYLALRQVAKDVIRKNENNFRLGFSGSFVYGSSLFHVNGPYCGLLLSVGNLKLEDAIIGLKGSGLI